MANRKKKPEAEIKLDNGAYADTLLGGGAGPAFGRGAQLSQTDTLERIIRGYLITNNFMLLCRLYSEVGIIQNFIDIPVQHALKGGFEIETKQFDKDEIDELIEDIDTNKDMDEVMYAMIWKRLFGGAGLVTLDKHNPDSDFDMDQVQQGDEINFKAADLWELNSNLEIKEDYTPGAMDRLSDGQRGFHYYGKKLSPSRVKILKGKRAPSHIRAMLRGWGLSEVEDVIRSINQYIKTGDLTFEVMDEFKIDVFKFKGLANNIASPKGQALVQERITVANMQKNYNNGIALDSEDDFDHKHLTFAGLAEIMNENKKNVASDLRIPITILFGQSAAGFNSGEDDIENFNSMIESAIRPEALHLIKYIVKVRCLAKFGTIPDDLKITLKPLREMSSLDIETMKTQQYTRLAGARSQGDIDSVEYREAANKQSLFGVQLDEKKDVSALFNRELAERANAENTSEQRLMNSFDESKIKRDSDGKFSANEVLTKKVKAKHPAYDLSRSDVIGSEVARDEAIAFAKRLRSEGDYASIHHLEGPKTGSRSKYAISVLRKGK